MVRQISLGVILKKTKAKITPRAGLILIEKVAQELGLEQLLGLHFGHLKRRAKGLSVARQILDKNLRAKGVSGVRIFLCRVIFLRFLA